MDGVGMMRVAIDLGEYDADEYDEGEGSDSEEQFLELLVRSDTQMEELMSAATARLGEFGKRGWSVSVLEFGGRALGPKDSPSQLMRVVSAATRDSWIKRLRPLILRARLSPAPICSSVTTPTTSLASHTASSSAQNASDMLESRVLGEKERERGDSKEERARAASMQEEEEPTARPQRPEHQSRQHPLQPTQAHALASPLEAQEEEASEAGVGGGGRACEAAVTASPPANAFSRASELAPPGATGALCSASPPPLAAVSGRDMGSLGKRVVSVVVKDVFGGRTDLELHLPPSLSIAELKGRLCMAYNDSPVPERQRIVCHSRHISDEETVGQLVVAQGAGGVGAGGIGGRASGPALDAPVEIFVTIHPRC
jgi:hypothetical protein